MKKIVLGCAAVLLSLGLLAGCNKDDDVDDKINNTGPEENEPTDDGNEGTTDTGPGPEEGGDGGSGTTYPAPTGEEDPAYFGFEVDGVGYYATGTTPASYSYEGNLTTSVEEAVLVSIEKGEAENEFYLSFGEPEAEKYITIIETTNTSGTHINLSYATEKASIYWNETYGCWGDASEEYFLCYNATYGCLYCSDIASWIDSSPIATLIEPAEVSELTIHGPSKVNIGETITLEAVVNLGASNAVTWSTEDEEEHITVDETTGEVTGVAKTDADSPVVVTATAVDSEVSASIEITVVKLVPKKVETTSLVSGESYYFGFESSNTYYFFNGTTDSYGDYLLCSTTLSEAVAVKVTIDNESYGFTFELGGTEYTIYAWPGSNNSTQYGEITFIETSKLASAKDGAVTTFTWNSTSSRFEVVLTNGTWYFGSNASRSEISLSDTTKTYTASCFYNFVEAEE